MKKRLWFFLDLLLTYFSDGGIRRVKNAINLVLIDNFYPGKNVAYNRYVWEGSTNLGFEKPIRHRLPGWGLDCNYHYSNIQNINHWTWRTINFWNVLNLCNNNKEHLIGLTRYISALKIPSKSCTSTVPNLSTLKNAKKRRTSGNSCGPLNAHVLRLLMPYHIKGFSPWWIWSYFGGGWGPFQRKWG